MTKEQFEAWTGGLELPEGAAATLHTAFNEETGPFHAEAAEHQQLSEANAGIAERERKAAELETANQSRSDQLAQWRTEADKTLETKTRELEVAHVRSTQLEERLRSNQELFGVDADDLLKGDPKPDPKTPPASDTATMDKRYLTREDAQSFTEAAMVPLIVNDIASEYQDLTGNHLSGHEKLVREAVESARKDPAQFERSGGLRGHLANHLGFDKLREDKQAASTEAEIERRVKEEREKIISELGTDGAINRSPGREGQRESFLYKNADKLASPEAKDETGKPAPHRIDPNASDSRVRAASQAFHQGTYRRDQELVN